MLEDGICNSSGFRPYVCVRRGVSKPCDVFDMADTGAEDDPGPEVGFDLFPKLMSGAFAVGVYGLSWSAATDPEFVSAYQKPGEGQDGRVAHRESFHQKHHHPDSHYDHVAQKQRRYGGARGKAFFLPASQ